eukprot:GHVP01021287.1.p1 GENE.GHVP01021287.1~~GHVP01021287.1.p1  ORF type:complete len:456 (-),score=87.63 GHVP01021287.1:97-1464(-)
MEFENLAKFFILVIHDDSEIPGYNNPINSDVEVFKLNRALKKSRGLNHKNNQNVQQDTKTSYGRWPYVLMSIASATIGLLALYSVHSVFKPKQEISQREPSQFPISNMVKNSKGSMSNTAKRNFSKSKDLVERPVVPAERRSDENEESFCWLDAQCETKEIPETKFSPISKNTHIKEGVLYRSLLRNPCRVQRAKIQSIVNLFDLREYWDLDDFPWTQNSGSESSFFEMGSLKQFYQFYVHKKERNVRIRRKTASILLKQPEFSFGGTKETLTSVFNVGEDPYFSVTIENSKIDFSPVLSSLLVARLSVWQEEKDHQIWECVEDVIREFIKIFRTVDVIDELKKLGGSENISGSIKMHQGTYYFNTERNNSGDGRIIYNSTDQVWIKWNQYYHSQYLKDCQPAKVDIKSAIKNGEKSKTIQWPEVFPRYKRNSDLGPPERGVGNPKVERKKAEDY